MQKRPQKERKARPSAGQFSRLFSQVPAAIAVLSGPDHIYTFANSRYQKMFDRSSEALLGKPLREVFPEVRDQGIYDLFHQVYTSKEAYVTHEFYGTFREQERVKSGYYNFVIQPILDDNGDAEELMVQTFEVTEQVLARNKVKESQERFNVIANAMPQIVWMAEADGRVTYYNDRVSDFEGSEKLPDGTWSWRGLLHPDDVDSTIVAWETAVLTGTIYEKEHRVKMKDGGYRWHLSRAFPQRGQGGRIVSWYGTATDVHRQKEAEMQYARLVAIVEASNDYIGLATTDGEILYINPPGLAIVGWNGFENRTIMDNIFPDDRYVAQYGYLPELLRNGSFSHEIRFLNEKTGKPVWMQWNGLVIRDIHSGEITALATTSQDITQRKEIESALKESENRFRNIADSAPVMIWTAGKDARVTFWNKTWLNFTGRTFEEALDVAWVDVIHPDDAPKAFRLYEESFVARKPYVTEIRFKGADDTYNWFLANAIPSYNTDGDFVGFTGTVTDIQDIKNAEIAVRESEERFRIMADATPTIVWALTPEGSHKYLNRFALEYLGVSLEKAVELDWQPFIHPDDFESTRKTLAEAIANRRVYSKEHRLLRHDGQYRWYLSQGAPSYYATGELYGYVGSGTDIHDWKLAQAVLKKNEEMLEQLVAERTSQLKRSNEDLQQFAHVASHDLKEPLRKIKTFAYRLEDEYKNSNASNARTYVSKILSAADRLTTMVDGVLTFSQADSIDAVIETVDLNEVIDHIKTDLEVALQHTLATIEKDDLPVLQGARVLLYQLFYNLINNSLKFSRPGVAPRITITSSVKEVNSVQYAEVILSDNGIGFEREYQDKIFEPFLRLHSKDNYEGSGLGLSLCRKIVTRHGGWISAKGHQGEGAQFFITLPVKRSILLREA